MLIMSMLIMSVYIMCRTINGLRESLSSDEITDPRLSLDPLLVDEVRLFVFAVWNHCNCFALHFEDAKFYSSDWFQPGHDKRGLHRHGGIIGYCWLDFYLYIKNIGCPRHFCWHFWKIIFNNFTWNFKANNKIWMCFLSGQGDEKLWTGVNPCGSGK